jgi:hypothetical protein
VKLVVCSSAKSTLRKNEIHVVFSGIKRLFEFPTLKQIAASSSSINRNDFSVFVFYFLCMSDVFVFL